MLVHCQTRNKFPAGCGCNLNIISMETPRKQMDIDDTQAFWDANPCDGQQNYDSRAQFRYTKEPWLIPEINRIAGIYDHIIELGCGQGTDAFTFCHLLRERGSYLGIDCSQDSLKSAQRTLANLPALRLKVIPRFEFGSIETLPFQPNTIDCIYSMGVLHHTPNIEVAIAEIYRVLKPGGKAYITLYRRHAPKLLIANLLRKIQAGFDHVLGIKQTFYQLVRRCATEHIFGTALVECFGVPFLRSYTKRDVLQLFAAFKIERLKTCGTGVPRLFRLNKLLDGSRWTLLHYLWLIEVQKPFNHDLKHLADK